MDFSHIYNLHYFFASRRYPVPRETIQQEFGYSKTTFHDITKYMRDLLGAPIKSERGLGYYYDLKDGKTFELPGLWFNAKEIIALVMLEQVSISLQPDFVRSLFTPVSDRLEKLLEEHKVDKADWQHRLKVVTQWQRNCEPAYFMNICQALLSRKQLKISYWKWTKNQTSERVISPQRIVFYRNNWYLDAWCHKSEAIKTFAVDAVRSVENSQQVAYEVELDQLEQHVSSGYGIFSGEVKHIAKLKFTGKIAHRVCNENWHRNQTSEWQSPNEYILNVPYSQSKELVRDVLSYGSNVEVISPTSLKQEIKQELQKTIKKYL